MNPEAAKRVLLDQVKTVTCSQCRTVYVWRPSDLADAYKWLEDKSNITLFSCDCCHTTAPINLEGWYGP